MSLDVDVSFGELPVAFQSPPIESQLRAAEPNHFFDKISQALSSAWKSVVSFFTGLFYCKSAASSTPFNWAVLEQQYRQVYANAGLDPNQVTALQKHVVFFANPNGIITRASMQKGLERLNFWKITAFFVSLFIFRALVSKMGIKNGAIHLRDIPGAMHASDTGVYDQNGNFVEARFEAIRQFAHTNPEFITAKEIEEMRRVNSARDRTLPGGKSGASASKGEFDLTLKLFADRTFTDPHGKEIKAISFQRLREFYTEGPKLFEEVAAR